MEGSRQYRTTSRQAYVTYMRAAQRAARGYPIELGALQLLELLRDEMEAMVLEGGGPGGGDDPFAELCLDLERLLEKYV
jgi:hypothetical protein